MNIEELREYCLSVKDATEDMPFEDQYLMFRVKGKWFAVIPLHSVELKLFLKCDPDKAIELREKYNCVEAAWHFNKKYWNGITLNQDMNDETVTFWIRHSVEEVIKKLPKKTQTEYWGQIALVANLSQQISYRTKARSCSVGQFCTTFFGRALFC